MSNEADDSTNHGWDDARARRHLTGMLVLGTLLGLAWVLHRYGTLMDVRAWNLIGLVVIGVVFLWTVAIGLCAWRKHRAAND